MARDPRAFTQPWRLVEVTSVTIQNRYLLRPSAELNDLVIGVVGRAQRKYEMPILCITVLSSHFHILLLAQDANHMASFMDFVNTNISKEVGTLHDWPGTMFPDRYHHIEVSDDPDDQIARLKYCLSNGVKEFLVDHVADWPGVQSAEALVSGKPLIGHWYNRSREYAARQLQKEKDIDEEDFATEERIVFSPLPCWEHLPEHEWRQRVAGLIAEIEEEGARARALEGKTSQGVKRILMTQPQHRPKKTGRSPKPRFHAKNPEVWKQMWEAWREIVTAFWEASERLLAGERDVEFPEG
ncbi:MAG: hypothetical protein GY722_27585, partial [bacterium]|nr:hypothetical protein [bacterium]